MWMKYVYCRLSLCVVRCSHHYRWRRICRRRRCRRRCRCCCQYFGYSNFVRMSVLPRIKHINSRSMAGRCVSMCVCIRLCFVFGLLRVCVCVGVETSISLGFVPSIFISIGCGHILWWRLHCVHCVASDFGYKKITYTAFDGEIHGLLLSLELVSEANYWSRYKSRTQAHTRIPRDLLRTTKRRKK